MARLGQFRRDTYENWLGENPIIADGEFILVAMDSSRPTRYTKFTCGDGISLFSKLTLYDFQEGGGGSGGSCETTYNNVRDFGAFGDGKHDDTKAIQNAIDDAYKTKRLVYIPSGTYCIMRSIYIYDGIQIKGEGIYNTILKTPFDKTDAAKACVSRDKKRYNTLTEPSSMPEFDIVVGHNRFHLGDGVEGYYDGDRDTNPSHPLYWPNDGSEAWKIWNSERSKIISRGVWIGKTGRENYGMGLFKSSQQPGLDYSDYPSKIFPYGTIHTGIRNVKISDLQITTNSIDRSKDSAINFQYKAENIPSAIRETYDSSVLNIQLYNLYLFSLGKSGYRATRAVDHTIIGCYIRQTAEQGIYLNGVTSISISGCYCNSCLEGGYVLRGCNYCSITACAADSCSIGYNLYNCKGVSLNSCGCEATRYQKAEEAEEEDLSKGRAFVIRNCDGISLISCYTMTSHPKVYSDEIIDVTNDELDENWLKSRHMFVSESKNVQASYCYFKSFERIRSTPYRNEDNKKVNYQGGTYDPTKYGSRYWQIQNYLVGAQFEIRGEESSVSILCNESKENMTKTSEIRIGNLDILDPGTVPNPLLLEGYSTAGKTLSGEDGNGGWTVTENGEVKRVSFENFEFVFPINAKKIYGNREKFWNWRNSLLLIRRRNDESLKADYPNKYYGYVSLLLNESTTMVNWNTVPSETIDKFKIDIVSDYSKSSFIDGSKEFFLFGKFSWQQLDKPIAFEPSLFTPIPALVRDKPEGCRIVLNSNTIKGFPINVQKASVSVIGNKYIPATDTTEEVIPGIPLVVMTQLKLDEMNNDSKVMTCTDIKEKDYFSVYSQGKALSVKEKRFISNESDDWINIPPLTEAATLPHVINKVNSLIDRLIAHGFIAEPITDVTFEMVGLGYADIANKTTSIAFKVITQRPIYRAGVAYSVTNIEPTVSNNFVSANKDSALDRYVTTSIKSNSRPQFYLRAYVELTQEGGASNRVYSETYILTFSDDDISIKKMA